MIQNTADYLVLNLIHQNILKKWLQSVRLDFILQVNILLDEDKLIIKNPVFQKPSMTVVEAITDVYLAVLDKSEYQSIYYTLKRKLSSKYPFYLNDFWAFADFQPAAITLDMIEYFLKTPMFKNCKKESLLKLVSLFKEKTLIRKEVLYYEGSEIDNVYLVFQGEFEVTKRVNIKPDSHLTQEIKQIKDSKIMGKINKSTFDGYKITNNCLDFTQDTKI